MDAHQKHYDLYADAPGEPADVRLEGVGADRVITRGLAKSGRLCTIEMELDDKPGELVEVCSEIGRAHV